MPTERDKAYLTHYRALAARLGRPFTLAELAASGPVAGTVSNKPHDAGTISLAYRHGLIQPNTER